MIIRRLAESLRNQNLLTFLVELVIVVVGIFIALQVDDWNQARKDRADERAFIIRLHDELLTSLELQRPLRERRHEQWLSMVIASDVLFERKDRDQLAADECVAVGASSFLITVTFELPSVEQLISTGRLNIVQNEELRLALIRLQQLSKTTMGILESTRVTYLISKFPDSVQLEGYWNDDEGEVRGRFTCNLTAMRRDKGFLSDFSLNMDSFDTFYNRGIKRELAQLQNIHELLDQFLDINHNDQPN